MLELLSPDIDFKVPLDLTHPESQQPFAGHSRDEVRRLRNLSCQKPCSLPVCGNWIQVTQFC